MNNKADTVSHSPFTHSYGQKKYKYSMCVSCLDNHSHLQLPRNVKSYKDQAIDEDGTGVDQQTYHLPQSSRILCSID